MTKLLTTILLSAAILVVIRSAAASQAGPIRIVVLDQSGAPIWNARLTVLTSNGELLESRKVDQHGQAELPFIEQRYSLCVEGSGFESSGFITRELQLDVTKQTVQPTPVILELRNCTNCVQVQRASPDLPTKSPQIPPLDDEWVADTKGRIFLPHACMHEWAIRTASIDPLPFAIPEVPNLDDVWLPNEGNFALSIRGTGTRPN